MKKLILSVLASCAWCIAAPAADLGDNAAPLAIKEWVKGAAVDVTDAKNIYVVEFWATWCPPCRTTIPHLTELQKKLKDRKVVIVGVSDEDAAKVKPFVQKMGDQMEYLVAVDDGRKTSAAYMGAFGVQGIPHAFIVKEGKIIWHGHPMSGLDATLEQVLAGKYTVESARKQAQIEKDVQTYAELVQKGDAAARPLGEKIVAGVGDDVDTLCGLALLMAAQFEPEQRDYALAGKALDQAEKAAGAKDARVLATRGVVLFESGKRAEGEAAVKQALENAKDDDAKAMAEHFLKVMEARKAEAKPQE